MKDRTIRCYKCNGEGSIKIITTWVCVLNCPYKIKSGICPTDCEAIKDEPKVSARKSCDACKGWGYISWIDNMFRKE